MRDLSSSIGSRFAPVQGNAVQVGDRLILNLGGRWTLVTILRVELAAESREVIVRLLLPTRAEAEGSLDSDGFYDREREPR